MGLWEKYKKEQEEAPLIEGVAQSMVPLLADWLYGVVESRYFEPYQLACDIQNRFRINDIAIPQRRPNNYIEPTNEWKLLTFLMMIADKNSKLFFVVIDYVLQKVPSSYSSKLKEILDDARHKYQVQIIDGQATIVERITKEEIELMADKLKGEETYESEFQDAFKELYGLDPNYTNSAQESFQALESLLKTYIGPRGGNNLGSLLNWLITNKKKWEYTAYSKDQEDPELHIVSVIDYINKSFRAVKHGQVDSKLKIEKHHAEVILRYVCILIFEFENNIKLR